MLTSPYLVVSLLLNPCNIVIDDFSAPRLQHTAFVGNADLIASVPTLVTLVKSSARGTTYSVRSVEFFMAS